MDVLDDEGERLLPRAALDRLPNRQEDLLRPTGGESGLELVLGRCRAEDLAQGPVRNPFPIREAAARQHDGPVTELRRDLPGKPRLPDAGRADDGDEPATAVGDRLLERTANTVELPGAAHERGVEPALERLSAFADVHQPVRGDGLGLALRRQRRDRLDLQRAACQPERLLAKEDLARGSGLLETGGDVDRVAGRKPLLRSDDDLAGVDAHSNLQGDAEGRHEVLVQAGDGLTQLTRCARRSQGIILVDGRHAENRHHGVADELFDGRAMSLEAGAGSLEVTSHDRAEGFGVELLSHRRRPGDVGEENRDDLPCLARTGPTERRTAGGAEACVIRVAAAAGFARWHARSVREIPSPLESELTGQTAHAVPREKPRLSRAFSMVRLGGFEPPTRGLEGRRSVP